MSQELLNALQMVADERRMSLDDLVATIEEAVTIAAIKRLERSNLEARYDTDKGEFLLFEIVTAVEEVIHPEVEIDLEEARALDPEAEPESDVRRPVKMEGLGRIAAQSVRQMIIKKGREAETASLRERYRERAGELVNAQMTRKSNKGPVFDLGNAEGLLPVDNQLAHDRLERGRRYRLVIDGVSEEKGAPLVILSRVSADLLRRLIELETPEIGEDQVVIKAIARDQSGASKVAVTSRRKDIDPVGAIIGARGSRIQPVSKELAGEKIDVVTYSDDPATFIKVALTPAKKLTVFLDEKEKSADVVADDKELSLAIGKKGVNVRLAVRLTGWKLDVMSAKERDEKLSRAAEKETASESAGEGEGAEETSQEGAEGKGPEEENTP